MKKINTKALAYTAILLAICIVSQFFKNMSVYITGPIINTCLIVCVVMAGIPYGIILSVITPITSFIITGSPIMAAIPAIIPFVMLGNAVLCVCVHFLQNKPNTKVGLPLSVAVGAVLKAVVMGLTISAFVIPMYLPEKMLAKKVVFQTTFSITQLITAAIGGGIAMAILIPLRKIYKNN